MDRTADEHNPPHPNSRTEWLLRMLRTVNMDGQTNPS
jgi:hypothetical protein